MPLITISYLTGSILMSNCRRKIVRTFFSCWVGLLLVGAAGLASAEERDTLVYYSTDDFEVNEFERRMYLRKAPPDSEGTIGSRARNLQALSDLYAMKTLALEASKGEPLLTQQERDWIAAYAVQLEVVNLYVAAEVDRRLASTDWKAEAREVYLAEYDRFLVEETVTIRTLLIRTDNRSEREALDAVLALRDAATRPSADFAEIVRGNTEDETARDKAGLMEIRRGQTVAPFEAAAFELSEPGTFSEPVVSQFGVHLIQLLEHKQTRQKAFDEVEQQITDELMSKRAAEYRQSIQQAAREVTPEGFVEHTRALDALMSRTSDGLPGRD